MTKKTSFPSDQLERLFTELMWDSSKETYTFNVNHNYKNKNKKKKETFFSYENAPNREMNIHKGAGKQPLKQFP